MSVIKFSHDYPKLHGQTSAELLAVRPIRIDKNTPKELLEYDTTYYVTRELSEVGLGMGTIKEHFPLATGDYIQLVFIGNLRIPFCTIRRAWPQSKVNYYKSKIGEQFEVMIKPVSGNEAEK